MNIDWSSVLIVIGVVLLFLATVYFDEKVKEWKRKKASLFPVFNITKEEAHTLCTIYNEKDWHLPYLCYKVIGHQGKGGSLIPKIRKALGDNRSLTVWLTLERGQSLRYLRHEEDVNLRKQWIKALLEYNNYSDLLEK